MPLKCKKCGGCHTSTTKCFLPTRGERWKSSRTGRTVRVMSESIEGYIIVRYKGAMPFFVHQNNWFSEFTIKLAPESAKGGE